jgi:hypothetical protein
VDVIIAPEEEGSIDMAEKDVTSTGVDSVTGALVDSMDAIVMVEGSMDDTELSEEEEDDSESVDTDNSFVSMAVTGCRKGETFLRECRISSSSFSSASASFFSSSSSDA